MVWRSGCPQITLRLVPFLFILYIIAYLDRINVGFAALQMQGQLGFSDNIYGNGAGAFFIGYFFFQVPSNLILQKLGAKRWICILMITWGIISCCMMFVRTPLEFYGMRFLLGLAEAGFFPGMIFYLRSWFPADARARTVAWFMTAATLSPVIGGPISGALLEANNPHGLAGWQWMFLMEGIPAIIMGAVVLVYLTDRPEIAAWLSDKQRSWLIGTLAEEKESVPSKTSGSLKSVFSNINIWLLALTYFGLNTCSYGMSLFLPKMIKNIFTGTPLQIGFLTTIPYIAATFSVVLIGFNSDRTGERKFHTGLAALAAACCLAGRGVFNFPGPYADSDDSCSMCSMGDDGAVLGNAEFHASRSSRSNRNCFYQLGWQPGRVFWPQSPGKAGFQDWAFSDRNHDWNRWSGLSHGQIVEKQP